jgi:hypothetical protein
VGGGGAVSVVTPATTTYIGATGAAVDAATFFTALPTATTVKARGVYQNGTLTVASLSLNHDRPVN